MYLIKVNGHSVYACTDPSRFTHEAAKYAKVANATFDLEVIKVHREGHSHA